MQHEHQETGDAECANCGHAQRFHERGEAADAENETVCTSPEDGTPCPCEEFEPV